MVDISEPQPSELVCMVCETRFRGSGKRENRVCHDPRCFAARRRWYWIKRAVKEAQLSDRECALCKAPPEEGSKYCLHHKYLREVCPGPCGGNLVRRAEGLAPPRRYCSRKCRLAVRASRKCRLAVRASRQAAKKGRGDHHPAREVHAHAEARSDAWAA